MSNDREIFESHEFELDHNGNFNPEQQTSGTVSTDGLSQESGTNKNTTVSVDSDNIDSNEVESNNEVVELDTSDNTVSGTGVEEENQPEQESDDMKFNFGEEEEPETESEPEPEEDRIAQLEKQIQELADNKSFEEKYSKDKMVMPGVSEYDYALMGKDFAEKGTLTDEQYSKLEELGYSKEVVDSFGNQQLQQAQQQPAQPSESDIKNDFASRLEMSSDDFDGLLDDVKTVFNEKQKTLFDESTPEKQIEMLQNFRLQKVQHEQKLKDRKLIKGNGASNEKPKGQFDDVSNDDIQSRFLKAINNGESKLMLAYSTELIKRGIKPNF